MIYYAELRKIKELVATCHRDIKKVQKTQYAYLLTKKKNKEYETDEDSKKKERAVVAKESRKLK